MTIVIMKKDELIEAIAKEPLLKSGDWVKTRMLSDASKPLDEADLCAMCAVGTALVRLVLDPKYPTGFVYRAANDSLGGCAANPESDMYYDVEAQELAERGEYMAALSVFFEGCWSTTEMMDVPQGQTRQHYVRQRTIEFVNAHFPEEIEFSIGPVIPRAGVKYVEGSLPYLRTT